MKFLFGKPSASSTYNFLDNFNVGSLLTLPTQTIGNVLVATANTLNTVLDVVSPIGLLGNALLGPIFQVAHKTGDTIIDAVSDVVAGVGQGLGATTEYRDTHYDNEWVNESLTLDNVLTVVPELVGNVLVGGTNIVNDLQDIFVPAGQLANEVFGQPFTQVHQSIDQIADLVSDVVANLGEQIGATVEQNSTHLDNEWTNSSNPSQVTTELTPDLSVLSYLDVNAPQVLF